MILIAQTPRQSPATIVDSADSLQSFISELVFQTEFRRSITLYIDLEGINLCRHGTVSILTLLVKDDRDVDYDELYLIDVHALGSSAFTTHPSPTTLGNFNNPSTKTLREILESPLTPKVIFDVRNDSDALFSHFGIKLQGVIDLQLMENAARKGCNKRLVHGLSKCIKDDSVLPDDQKRSWEAAKDDGRRLFAPELGGRFEVFNQRPLSKEIKAYCEQDVRFLPHLYNVYEKRLGIMLFGGLDWTAAIGTETKKRLEESWSQEYEPNGRHKALAPVWAPIIIDHSLIDHSYPDGGGAWDCPGWEEDMAKNGDM